MKKTLKLKTLAQARVFFQQVANPRKKFVVEYVNPRTDEIYEISTSRTPPSPKQILKMISLVEKSRAITRKTPDNPAYLELLYENYYQLTARKQAGFLRFIPVEAEQDLHLRVHQFDTRAEAMEFAAQRREAELPADKRDRVRRDLPLSNGYMSQCDVLEPKSQWMPAGSAANVRVLFA